MIAHLPLEPLLGRAEVLSQGQLLSEGHPDVGQDGPPLHQQRLQRPKIFKKKTFVVDIMSAWGVETYSNPKTPVLAKIAAHAGVSKGA